MTLREQACSACIDLPVSDPGGVDVRVTAGRVRPKHKIVEYRPLPETDGEAAEHVDARDDVESRRGVAVAELCVCVVESVDCLLRNIVALEVHRMGRQDCDLVEGSLVIIGGADQGSCVS